MLWTIRTGAAALQPSDNAQRPAHRAPRHLGHHVEYVRRHGLVPFLEFTAYRLARRLARVRAFRLLELSASAVHGTALQLPPDCSARLLAPDELPRLAAHFPDPPTAGFVTAALAKGDACVAIFDGDRPVCTGWYSRLPTRLFDDLAVAFGEDSVYAYKINTAGSHRGRRLMAANQAYALRYLQPAPSRILSCIEASNRASLRASRWVGARVLGTFGYWRLHDRAIGYSSPRCERIAFAVRPLSPLPPRS